MVVNKTLRTLALGVCLSCVVGDIPALGLGEVEIHSSLGRPLVAEIPLFVSSKESFYSEEFVIVLADEATHRGAGLEYPYFLSDVKFSVNDAKTDIPVIRVTTPTAVSEPLLSFLIELRWTDVRLLKEVTILLDPPSSNSQVANVKHEKLERTDTGNRSAVGDSRPVRTPKTAPTSVSDMPSYGPVARGETLSRIASRFRPSRNVSLREMMWGIFKKNPHAFGASMDVLKRGALLNIPTAQELAQIKVSDLSSSKVPKSPAKVKSRRVTKPPALESAPSSESDAESEEQSRLHILGSESDPIQEDQIDNADGSKPLADNSSVSPAISTMPMESMKASATSVELRLEHAVRDVKMLRTENQSMRNTIANMQNELLVNGDRLERIMKKYEQLVDASKTTQTTKAVEAASSNASWVPWLTLFLAVGVISGIGMIGWKTRKSRHKLMGLGTVGDSSSTSIPLDEILDAVQSEGMLDSESEHANVEAPREIADPASHTSQEPSISQLLKQRGTTKASNERTFNDRAHSSPENHGGVIAEYIATGELDLTDAKILREIVNSEGNDEVKLVLLAFYRELGRHEELQRLADEILERHSDADPEFLNHVLAIKRSVSEVVKRSAVPKDPTSPSYEESQQLEVAPFKIELDKCATTQTETSSLIEDTLNTDKITEIYQPDQRDTEIIRQSRRGSRLVHASDPSHREDVGNVDLDNSEIHCMHDHETFASQSVEQSGVEREARLLESNEVFEPETEIMEEEPDFDDLSSYSSFQIVNESTGTEPEDTQVLDDVAQTNQLNQGGDRTEEFAPGMPDFSLLDGTSGVPDNRERDTLIWIDGDNESESVILDQDESDEWFRLHTGSGNKD